MNHSVKRRRQALHQTHHHYYLNISVEAANISDWRIQSKLFLPELECSRGQSSRRTLSLLSSNVSLVIRITVIAGPRGNRHSGCFYL